MGKVKRDKYGLSDKERRYADELLVINNATEAYMIIFDTVNRRTASAAASKLTARPHVSAYITLRREQLSNKKTYTYDISQGRILKELERLAFYDMEAFHDEDGNLIPLNEMDADSRAVVQGYKTNGVYNITEKRAALELLMKAKGMFEQHQKQGAAVTVIKVPDITKEEGAGV